MQAKLKPGDTFDHEYDGTTYRIRVMSVDDEIQLSEETAKLEKRAKDEQDATYYYKAWRLIVSRLVVGWDRAQPIEEIGKYITKHDTGELAQACIRGNAVTDDEAKN